MNITMKARTENTLTLSWEPPKCGDRGGEMTSFNYQLINLNDTSEPIKGSTTSNVITLTDLEPMHMYEFEVAAETGVGRGPYSTSLAYNTLDEGMVKSARYTFISEDFFFFSLFTEPLSFF